MASPEEMGAYYENHPDPDVSSTWGEAESVESAMEPPLEPPPIPGPPAPGFGMPVANTEGLFANSGRFIGLGRSTVFLGRVPMGARSSIRSSTRWTQT